MGVWWDNVWCPGRRVQLSSHLCRWKLICANMKRTKQNRKMCTCPGCVCSNSPDRWFGRLVGRSSSSVFLCWPSGSWSTALTSAEWTVHCWAGWGLSKPFGMSIRRFLLYIHKLIYSKVAKKQQTSSARWCLLVNTVAPNLLFWFQMYAHCIWKSEYLHTILKSSLNKESMNQECLCGRATNQLMNSNWLLLKSPWTTFKYFGLIDSQKQSIHFLENILWMGGWKNAVMC